MVIPATIIMFHVARLKLRSAARLSQQQLLYPMAPKRKLSAGSAADKAAKVAKVVKTEPVIAPATSTDVDSASVNAKHHMAIKTAIDVIVKRFKKVHLPLDLGDTVDNSVIRGAQVL